MQIPNGARALFHRSPAPDPAPDVAGAPVSAARTSRVARVRGTLEGFYLLSFAALGIHAPHFPLWLEAHGFTGVTMSAIAALSPAMSFIGPPLVGALADSRGARGNLLTWACALASLAMFGLCAAEALGLSRVFPVVFGVALVYALGRSPVILLADRIALEHGGNYGRRRVWGSIGFLLAASSFGQWFPGAWRWLPGALGLCMASAALASAWLPRSSSLPSAPLAGDIGTSLGRRRAWPFLICAALFSASHSSIDLCGSLYFRDLGARGGTIGLLWGTGVIAEIVFMAALGGAVGGVRAERLLVLGYLGGGLRWLLTAALPSAELAFFVQPLHAVSFAVVWLSSLEHVKQSSAPHALGSAQGLLMAANATGSVAGMLTWGPLYSVFGGSAVFLCATGLALAAAGLAYGALYRQREVPAFGSLPL